jgi:hypothetical protein
MAVTLCDFCKVLGGCDCHVIISLEHSRDLLTFWCPDGRGYTTDLEQAGRWPSMAEAMKASRRDFPVRLDAARRVASRMIMRSSSTLQMLLPDVRPGQTDRSEPAAKRRAR